MKYSTGLPTEFLRQYDDMSPPWGPVGYVTYKRTYARMIAELGRTEEWHETCTRVCNGIVEIGGLFKEHELTSLYDNMFHLKGLPSGRAIWQLGTDTVERLGADSLCNCWLVVCNDLEAFCFAFDELMLGGGVGFNILPEYVYEMPRVKYDPPVIRSETPDCDFIVPDNREGWVELLRRVLQAFLVNGKPLTYSTQCVRAAGKTIHTFGGVASGSEPLVKGITQIVKILRKRVDEKLRPIDCMDVMNIIGTIVVSGNVRRSSQIAIGHHQDLEFLQAKDWNIQMVPTWRRMSNNTIACNLIQDLPDAYWKPYSTDGECYGLFNLHNCRRYGRIIDGLDYRPDFGVLGCNPCGESGLSNMEPCNLAETLLPNIRGLDEWLKILVPLYKVTKTIANHHYLYPETEEVVHRNYRVGVSLSGWMAAPWAHDKDKLDRAYRTLEDADKEYSRELKVPTSVKLTTVKPSGCRPGSEITTTNKGLLRLDELMEGHSEGETWSDFQGANNVLQGSRANKILKTFDNGSQQVYAVNLSYNTRLLATADHPWFVQYHRKYTGASGMKSIGKWVKTCDLQPDDILGFNQKAYTSTEASTFIHIDQEKLIIKSDTKRIRQPKKMTSDIAWLLGFFQGAGCLSESKYRVRFVKDRFDTLERVARIVMEVFGLQANILPASNREAFEISFSSKTFYHWFLENNLEKNGGVFRVIRESSVEHLLAYFAGLTDSDGCVYETSTNYWGFCITQSSEEFLREVQQVGWAIGLVMGLSHNTKGKNFQAKKDMWSLTACAHSIPENFERVLRHSIKATGVTGPYTTDRPGQNSPHIGLVKSVTPHDVVPTYDIEVENDHWYYNGAFKSHNTVSLLPYGCTPGMHAAYSRYLIRRIRFAANDPLVEVCRQHRYNVQPEVNQDGSYNLDTMVVEFPMDYGPKAITEDSVNVLQELETQRFLQTYWADQSVSCSHYFRRDEVDQIKEWLALNYSQSVKTCSFMHAIDHGFRQAPLEKITAEEYAKLVDKVVPITEITDDQEIDLMDSLECAGGSCPVK